MTDDDTHSSHGPGSTSSQLAVAAEDQSLQPEQASIEQITEADSDLALPKISPSGADTVTRHDVTIGKLPGGHRRGHLSEAVGRGFPNAELEKMAERDEAVALVLEACMQAFEGVLRPLDKPFAITSEVGTDREDEDWTRIAFKVKVPGLSWQERISIWEALVAARTQAKHAALSRLTKPPRSRVVNTVERVMVHMDLE